MAGSKKFADKRNATRTLFGQTLINFTENTPLFTDVHPPAARLVFLVSDERFMFAEK